LFSPDHRLQQEAEGRPVKLVIGGDRGLGVEQELPPHRDHPSLPGQGLEFWEGRKELHDSHGRETDPLGVPGPNPPAGARLNVLQR
jgi:hypothetical protein